MKTTITIIALTILGVFSLKAQTLQWSHYHNNSGNWSYNVPNDMTVDNSGNVYITGRKYGTTYHDYFTQKLSSGGSLLWAVTHGGSLQADDIANAIAVDNNGNVYVTGSTRDTVTNYADITTIKYSSSGSVLWIKSYNGPGHFDDIGKRISVDNNGNVIVAGTSYGQGTVTDYIVLKYSSSGTLIWQARYNGMANSYDELVDMKLDASGDVIVTGSSIGAGSGLDYATVRFNGVSGSQVWEARYNNTATGGNPDQASALAIASNGDVIVTGKSNSTTGGWDFLTQRYSGSTGTQQWTKRYDGSANSWDEPMAICCDRFNNVFVTGFTFIAGNSYSNTAVIKYNSAGGESWIKFHQLTPSTTESGRSIAVDSAGNAYVTAFPNGDNYFVNFKLSGQNGNLLWENNHLTGGYSDPVKILVDQNNSIYISGQAGSRSATLKFSQMTGINNNNNIAEDFRLEQNYPNPFNPATTISFSIVKNSNVKLIVYDITGKIIETLLNENRNAGKYKVIFNASNLSSGTYFYKIETDGFTDVKKMMFVK